MKVNTRNALPYGLFSILISSTPVLVAADTEEESIENIVVYAQKRAQDISDVAISVSVFDNKFVENRNLKDTTELSPLVPNFKITNNAGEGTPPAFNLRGVGMIDYNTSTVSPIAIYSDSVVSGSANNLSSNLFDVEQIEVLRGPQGTLFGRNTTGGAILVQSVMPGKEVEGFAKISIAQRDHTSIDAAITLPTSEHFSNRFAVNYEDYNFSTNNQFPGAPDGGLEQTNLRWIGLYQKDAIRATFKITAEDWTGAPKPIESAGIVDAQTGEFCSPADAGTPGCVDSFGFSVQSNDYWDTVADTNDRKHDTSSWSASAKVEWDFSNTTTFTSITAMRDLDRFHSWDSDGPGNFIEGSFDTQNELFSQEFSVTYKKDNVFWITGLYYLNEDIKQENDIDLFRDFRTIPGLESIGAQFFYHNTLENESTALYSQADWTLSEQFTVTAGLRFTDESTNYSAMADLDVVGAFIPGLWDFDGEVSDSEFSGKLALVQTLESGNTLYYSYSRGYKSGGYNAGYATTPDEALSSEYRPETLDAFEVGARITALENKLRANFSTFYYDYHDQQVFINISQAVSPFDVLRNAGDSTIYGAEAELWFAVNDNFDLSLNVGYIPEAEIGEYDNQGLVVEPTRLPFTSEWNISGSLFYVAPLGSGELSAQLGFDYQSDFFFDQNENPYTEQQAYTLWNGRVGYAFNDNWEFAIWGKNLLNEEYAELRFDSIAALSAVTELKGEKRQLGIEVAYQF